MHLGAELVAIRGAGDIATGIAHRLWRAGCRLLMLEIPRPTVIRRPVSLAEAVYEGQAEVEGMRGRLVDGVGELEGVWAEGAVPVLVDPEGEHLPLLALRAVVDAILAKRNLGTHRGLAPVVIGVGPGFVAGEDVHAVVETQRGHYLGRVILEGAAAPNTGVPGEVLGYAEERVIRAPRAGVWEPVVRIGDLVRAGQTVARVEGEPVAARLDGVVRGLLRPGLPVHPGMKAGDVDPRSDPQYCCTISDKARAVGGGVLEALLYLWRQSTGHP